MVIFTSIFADDIVRARLRTLGVEEHRFTMETGTSSTSLNFLFSIMNVSKGPPVLNGISMMLVVAAVT